VIHLDTSYLIRALVPRSIEERRLRAWLRRREPVRISSIAWAEFLCGPVAAPVIEEVAEVVGEPTSFDAVDAILAAEMFNAAGRRRGSLLDCMIAASALGANARLATSNPADFRRFVSFGLDLADA
jgi:predicted nucleic acid-binding protein